MDAIVTAGGIPLPGEPLYEECLGKSKALLEVGGKPMIQWVLDALDRSASVNRVVVIGLPADIPLHYSKPLTFMANHGGMLQNIIAGLHEVKRLNPAADAVVVAASDTPGLTAPMVDWVVDRVNESDDDIYYNVITRETMEKRYPGSKRTYTRLKDVEVCGGDLNVVRLRLLDDQKPVWMDIIEARKNPLKQAYLLGFDVLLGLLFRSYTLEATVKKVCQHLHIKGRALVCPYAELGMDVDKNFQLEIVRTDMAPQAAQKA
jgi:GTP:adenosylcobinamide-phosphate guanylyltransferase